MNLMKQILNFELKFLSDRIPYIKINNSDGKSKYFCIYRCYFKDGIKIYKVEPKCITIINIKDNNITETQRPLTGKAKPIACVDQYNGCFYFVSKDSDGYRIYSILEESEILKHKKKCEKEIVQNYFSKLLAYNNIIFVIQQYKFVKIDSKIEKAKAKKEIISAACDKNYLITFSPDCSIIFYNIKTLKPDKELNLSNDFHSSDFVYLFLNDNLLNIFSLSQKFIYKKIINKDTADWLSKGRYTSFYNLNAIQEINQNFIDKYMDKNNYLETTNKYKEVLPFVSEVSFPGSSYEGDILFFGPSIYIPLKKNVDSSLYSILNKIKNKLLSSKKVTKYLSRYSKNRDLKKLESKIIKFISDEEEDDIELNKNEVDYLLDVVELPESINDESIIPSSLMPSFFNFIVAEIINTFLNLLIIKGLEQENNDRLENVITVYSSLYRIISSNLVKYNVSKDSNVKKSEEEDDDNDDDDDNDNDDDDNDNDDDDVVVSQHKPNDNGFAQSNLYILNSSFSPLTLREQLWFLYKGNTTFSKLSNDDILNFNSICPEPLVEQRILDVAKAYLETNDLDKCIEYLGKIDMNNEDLGPIQNVYISHLLKQLPDDFEKQFKLLQSFKKRLPKNMYKSVYIISLKANQFSTAVDEFFSKDAIQSFAQSVKNNQETLGQYVHIIEEVIKEKGLVIELISK